MDRLAVTPLSPEVQEPTPTRQAVSKLDLTCIDIGAPSEIRTHTWRILKNGRAAPGDLGKRFA
jgi:hypothetical protein